jgi:hypothetical protein
MLLVLYFDQMYELYNIGYIIPNIEYFWDVK